MEGFRQAGFTRLDPHREEAARLLRNVDGITNTRIRELITEAGYRGSKTILDDYLCEGGTKGSPRQNAASNSPIAGCEAPAVVVPMSAAQAASFIPGPLPAGGSALEAAGTTRPSAADAASKAVSRFILILHLLVEHALKCPTVSDVKPRKAYGGRGCQGSPCRAHSSSR